MTTPVVALTHKSTADVHWRIARPFARLAEAGVDAGIHRLRGDDLPADLIRGRVVVLPRVVVQDDDPAASVAYVNRIRALGALAVVFEIDDDELSPAAEERDASLTGLTTVQLAQRARSYGWVRNMVAAVDAVTVSTEPLATVVRAYTAATVYTVPNAIDVPWFTERLVTRVPWSDHLTIGWAGYRRPEADLEPMAVAWGRIARRYPDVHFVVAGYQADCIYREIEDISRVHHVPWTPNLDEYPAMMQVDIGCCPLADNAFNRCKSPIKAWEYALAGACVVVSPAGPYQTEIFGALACPFATTDDNWESMLVALIDDEWTRALNGNLYRRHVLTEHRLTANLHRWTDTYSEIAARVGVRA